MMFQPVNDHTMLCQPTTVDAVVDLLFEDISLRDRVVMAGLSEQEFDSRVYLSMAKILRKEFGLYSGNDELLKSCFSYLGTDYDSFEDPAMVIIKELWKRVKNGHSLRLVEKKNGTST
ncbi:MAG: hypothetical protein COA36_16365 [Desulfotalea sp.]|nr:MAG: hypothetical protein COA36_16365 [Desulfotalea sp.]